MAVTPNFSWPVPVATDYVKDGWEAISDLGNAIDTTVAGLSSGALTLVKAQAVGTSVSSITVTSAFNSTYDNYKIVYTSGVPSASGYISLQMRTGTTTSTSNYYFGQNTVSYSNSQASEAGNNASSFLYIGHHNSGYALTQLDVDIYRPFVAARTVVRYGLITGSNAQQGVGFHDVATSYDQVVLTLGSGTVTGGTVYVYGYEK